LVIDLETPPLDKFRPIFPLLEPVNMLDLAPSIEGAATVWEDKITGLAVELLGVNFDAACTDVCRMFYWGDLAADEPTIRPERRLSDSVRT